MAPGLLAFHTLFVLEHNRLCDEYKRRHPAVSKNKLITKYRYKCILDIRVLGRGCGHICMCVYIYTTLSKKYYYLPFIELKRKPIEKLVMYRFAPAIPRSSGWFLTLFT